MESFYNLIIPPLLCLVSALCFEAKLSFILILWGKFIHFTTVLYSFGSDKFSYGYETNLNFGRYFALKGNL